MVDQNDPFNIAGILFGDNPQRANGFTVDAVPSASGFGTRQGQLQNNRAAYSKRNLMKWLVPEGAIIEMYINPQNVRYTHKKLINNTRTKGGYVLQYWGSELSSLSLTGTTGTSGIEGINVLNDLYLNEQIAFDPVALSLAAAADQNNSYSGAVDIFGIGSALSSGGDFISSLLGASQGVVGPSTAIPEQTLASLAFTVELYWSGEVYRGFFQSFSVTEEAGNLGFFNYDLEFIVTQKRGLRQNFLGWHRSATSGPSNSDPINGIPYSFSQLLPGDR